VQQRAFFEEDIGLPLTLEAETGKLFPVSDRARDVRDGLLQHARSRGVRFQFNSSLVALEPSFGEWRVHTTTGPIDATRVVVATGGLSVPLTGSDGTGLRITESLGHRVTPLYPALTPLTAAAGLHAGLSGVSLTVRLRARAAPTRKVVETSGGFLFTHRGYSGPAVLDVSHVATRHPAAVIRVQWTSATAAEWESMFASRSALVSTVMSTQMPIRLATQLLDEAAIPAERRANELRRAERARLIDLLTSYPLPWTGDEGFKKAEVTGGGIALDEVEPDTLQSRKCPRLYLCGEMLDAFGPIGGHNFAWAWATGRLAGVGAAGGL
jgi:hypothetical protein